MFVSVHHTFKSKWGVWTPYGVPQPCLKSACAQFWIFWKVLLLTLIDVHVHVWWASLTHCGPTWCHPICITRSSESSQEDKNWELRVVFKICLQTKHFYTQRRGCKCVSVVHGSFPKGNQRSETRTPYINTSPKVDAGVGSSERLRRWPVREAAGWAQPGTLDCCFTHVPEVAFQWKGAETYI